MSAKNVPEGQKARDENPGAPSLLRLKSFPFGLVDLVRSDAIELLGPRQPLDLPIPVHLVVHSNPAFQ